MMMAAVRCAARRLGGSLLQPTQPAVAEEGRRLVPSRFMRSRQFASENPKVEHLHRRKVVPEPDDTPLPWERKVTRVKSVLDGLGWVAYYVGITAFAVGVTYDKGKNK